MGAAMRAVHAISVLRLLQSAKAARSGLLLLSLSIILGSVIAHSCIDVRLG